MRDIQHNGFLIHDEGREMLNLSSNDYLGLSSNPRLLQEFRAETDVMALPYSAVSSRLLSGNHEYYKMLENDLADIYDKEAALVFNSGYHANIGILPALAGKKDLIVADKLVHASTIDGIMLSEAEMLRFRHSDYEHLRNLLVQHREKYENVFIVTESVLVWTAILPIYSNCVKQKGIRRFPVCGRSSCCGSERNERFRLL